MATVTLSRLDPIWDPASLLAFPDLVLAAADGGRCNVPRVVLASASAPAKSLLLDAGERADLLHLDVTSEELQAAVTFLVSGCLLPGARGALQLLGVNLDRAEARCEPDSEVPEVSLDWEPEALGTVQPEIIIKTEMLQEEEEAQLVERSEEGEEQADGDRMDEDFEEMAEKEYHEGERRSGEKDQVSAKRRKVTKKKQFDSSLPSDPGVTMVCVPCGTKFGQLEQLFGHSKACGKANQARRRKKSAPIFGCLDCNLDLATVYRFRRHLEDHCWDPAINECPQCGFKGGRGGRCTVPYHIICRAKCGTHQWGDDRKTCIVAILLVIDLKNNLGIF